ncbi:MAG: hypothetical protein Q8R33_15475 [Burkholderiales bacterium]|nr:hypothetical protein [Burkholderiales bacterium]
MSAKHIGFPRFKQTVMARGSVLRSPVVLTLIVGSAAAWAARVLQWVAIADSDLMQVAGTLAQVACTMLGFLLAALAVLASINHTHLVQMMKRTGHYRDLLLTLFVGCIAFLVCTLMSLLVLFGLRPGPDYLACLAGANVAAMFALTDSGRKFWMVLRNLQSES